MEFSIMEKETDDILFNTRVLRKFSLVQLKVLNDEIRKRIKERISETEPEKDMVSWEDCYTHADSQQAMGYRMGIAKGRELENKELIEEFIKAYKEDKMKVIQLNLNRNVNGQTHTDYNDIFNKRIEECEGGVK